MQKAASGSTGRTGTLTCLVGAKTFTEAGLFDTVTLSPSTTIATALMAASATTVTLAAASGIASDNYYRQIENEVVLVTRGQNTATETVTRSQLGTTTAAHAVGVVASAGGDGGADANAGMGGQTTTAGGPERGSSLPTRNSRASPCPSTTPSLSPGRTS